MYDWLALGRGDSLIPNSGHVNDFTWHWVRVLTGDWSDGGVCGSKIDSLGIITYYSSSRSAVTTEFARLGRAIPTTGASPRGSVEI